MTDAIKTSVMDGNLKTIEPEIRSALAGGASPDDVMDAMMDAMKVIGERFDRQELFLPDMMLSAKTMQRGVMLLRNLLSPEGEDRKGTLIIGTVKGDLHDIGKNLVVMLAESAGYQVVDLGVDVSAEQFLDLLRRHPGCRVVALSALLTTTLPSMEEIVKAIKAEFPDVKIMVGGAPVTEAFAAAIGADVYTDNAAETIRKLDGLMEKE